MANDLLYNASLHLGAIPQNKRSSLLYKIPTVGNRQHDGKSHAFPLPNEKELNYVFYAQAFL
jgi:hypothetical protein